MFVASTFTEKNSMKGKKSRKKKVELLSLRLKSFEAEYQREQSVCLEHHLQIGSIEKEIAVLYSPAKRNTFRQALCNYN